MNRPCEVVLPITPWRKTTATILRRDTDPVAGVMPRSGGQHRMRFGLVRGRRGLDRMSRVEVGVEGAGVVRIPLQRRDEVMVDVGERVVDGVTQKRVRAHLDESGVVLP